MPCRELRFVLSVVFYVVSENPQNRIRSKSCKKQKKTPVSSICRKRADYFCPSGRQLKPRKSEIRKALFRNDSSYAVFADDGERRVFSGKAELFAA